MAEPELTREAIELAIAECERLTRKVFLSTYGFKGARDYFLAVNGVNYDSKAIVAVAYKFLRGGEALRFDQLSGGAADAAGKLERLGFTVTKPGQNADWSWDEHVLALDLYMENPTSPPGKKHPKIAELSALLQTLGERMNVARTEKFRNANGVYMKLMNFRRLDPQFQEQGKSGLDQGANLERDVWERYAGDHEGLRERAALLRALIQEGAAIYAQSTDDDGDHEAEEGAIFLRFHKGRERSVKLARQKRKRVLATTGKLACEVCDFDFAGTYGIHGDGFIEVHHRMPISQLVGTTKTHLDDLAVVCANCHRMLHRGGLLDVHALRAKLTNP